MRDTAVTGVVAYAPGAPLTKSIASALQFCQIDVDPAFLNDRLHRMREIWVCFKVLRLHARDGRFGFVGKVQSSTTRLAASNRQRAAAIAPCDIVYPLFLAFSPVGGGSCGGLMTAVATWWLASRLRDGRLGRVRLSRRPAGPRRVDRLVKRREDPRFSNFRAYSVPVEIRA